MAAVLLPVGVITVGLLATGVWFAVTDAIRNGLDARGVIDFEDEDVIA